MVVDRKYLKTHKWITFSYDPKWIDARTWLLLGEAQSKIEHLARASLKPKVAEKLLQIYLTKGVHATTKIEGNTLTLEEVAARLEARTTPATSRGYLVQEVDNVLDALNKAMREAEQNPMTNLTVEDVQAFNRGVLSGLNVEDHVDPGHFRVAKVGVMRYEGAPPEDVEYLTVRMCDWINELRSDDRSFASANALIRAILAHLYIAWIHPFGDGNGRTARLVEWKILLTSGFPQPATHLLSNFYCRTRDEYYAKLDLASRDNDPSHFIRYAIRGFVDEIREQLNTVWEQQDELVWLDYLHEQFPDENGKASIRQRHLLIDLTTVGVTSRERAISVAQIPKLELSRFERDYGKLTPKSLGRDLIAITLRGLLVRTSDRKIFVNRDIVRAFRPQAIHPTLPGIDSR